MMSSLRTVLFGRNTIVLMIVLIVAALVFVLGPSLSLGGSSPLGSAWTRLIAALFLPSAYLFTSSLRQRARGVVNDRMMSALDGLGLSGRGTPSARAPDGRPTGDKAADAKEVQILAGRFREALKILKRRRFHSSQGRRWLYQLPWYVIIGPPGSGKTTAIANSGLSFPLADKFGRAAVGGIGGTRNCDWWFTDDAVMIDTAGRYTTQDSDQQRDRAAWVGFLKLLKRYRRRQPLNGVFVAISISEILSANEEKRLSHAASIRQRVAELYGELGVRLPVYMLFTKADLIAGFIEYFDDLGREGREAVWGVTFPFEAGEAGPRPVDLYGAEFDALVARLDERLLERVQQEGDIQRRALVFGFPQQVGSLREVTEQFVREVFEPNTFEAPFLLRGVYFASGTQVGTPLDRVMDAMSRTFAIAPRPQPDFAGSRRSYFLHRLLREVAFGEAWLVDTDARAARRLRHLRSGLLAALVLTAIGISSFWLVTYWRDQAMIGAIDSASADYAAKAASLRLERVADGNLRDVVNLLDRLRTIETGYADRTLPADWLAPFGFHQRAKLSTETRAAYRRALSTVLLPRLILRLENGIRTRQSEPAFLFPALEVYLMLGRQGPLAPDVVRRWMTLDWANSFPGPGDTALRNALMEHLDALLEAPFGDVGLDGDLIERTRTTLRQEPPAKRVLDAVMAAPAAARLPVWRVSDAAGPSAESVLRLRSGAPLSTGLPGLYTREGFQSVVLQALPRAADDVVAESWILDPTRTPGAVDPAESRKLVLDATGLYLQEFSLRWDHLIDDVAVQPVADLDDAMRMLNILSAPTSPIRLLVASFAKETTLNPVVRSAAGAAGSDPKGLDATGSDPGAPDALTPLFRPSSAPDTPEILAATYTADHFKALHALVQVPPNSGPGAQPPIDSAIADLGNLYRSITISSTDAAGPLQRTGQSGGAVERLKAGAADLPQPIRRWVLGIGEISSDLSSDRARDQLASLWANGPGRLCAQVVKNHYPFSRSSDPDALIGDVGRLFAPGGAIDAFFTQNLAPFVDTSRTPWQMRRVGASNITVDPVALAQFQRAADIRDSLFRSGGATPSVGFEMSIIDLDAGAKSVVVDIDGQKLTYAHGAPVSLRIQWPAPQSTGTASVSFTTEAQSVGPLAQLLTFPAASSTPSPAPDAATDPGALSASGPWALFRLLDRAGLHRTGGPDRMQARFLAGGHTAVIDLRADSVINPLDRSMLSQFRCPSGL